MQIPLFSSNSRQPNRTNLESMRLWTESREAELGPAEASPSPLNLEALEAKVVDEDEDKDEVQLSRVLEEICRVLLA